MGEQEQIFEVNPINHTSAPQRVELLSDVDETIVFHSDAIPVQGIFHIRNRNPRRIIYKVKTTTPENYNVQPLIGIIEGNTQQTVNVYVEEDVRVWAIPKDRFQVQVTIVPNEFHIPKDYPENDSGSSDGIHIINFEDMRTEWRSIIDRSDTMIEIHRLTSTLDNISTNPPSFTSPIPDPLSLRQSIGGASTAENLTTMRGHDDLWGQLLNHFEEKMIKSLNDNIDERIKYIEYLIYGIICLILIVGLILYLNFPSTTNLPENILECTTMDHVHYDSKSTSNVP